MSNDGRGTRTAFTGLVVACTLAMLAAPALAADPVFPPGSRVGLVEHRRIGRADELAQLQRRQWEDVTQ